MEKTKHLVCRLLMLCAVMLFALDVSAQTIISGHVKDDLGEDVIGASVLIKGAPGGTVTDFDGNFKVQCEPGVTLVISYIGYMTQEVVAKDGMEVIMKDDNALLDEVVVIGYGSVKKADATGSVMTFQADPKLKGVANNPQDMLVGKMAGVTVTTNGGAATDGATIRIRGGSSLSASNDPLIILDGVYIDNSGISGMGNILSTINPNDIESFTVLKDASATAIYGSRASNGVIIVTTKKGKSGQVKVSYNGSVTASVRRKDIDVFSGDEYRKLVSDIFAGDSRYDEVMSKLGTENTDWQKELFRTGVSTDHSAQLMGSLAEWLPVRVSLGYTNTNGILKTDHQHRYTGSVNLNPEFFKGHLKLNLNGRGQFQKNNFADRSTIKTAVSMNPTVPVMDPNSQYGGYWSWTDANGQMLGFCDKNPVAGLDKHNDYAHAWNMIGSAQIEYNAFYVEGLKANLNLSIDGTHSWGENVDDYDQPYNNKFSTLGTRSVYSSSKRNSLLDFYLTYNKDLKEIKSHFDVMAGYSWQHFYNDSDSYTYWLSDPTHVIGDSEGEGEYFLISFFGRANYTFADRYMVTATVRRDGTSRFQNHKWGLFPSVALGWNVKKESFMQGLDLLSTLKLRASWGMTGQQSVGGYYDTFATFYTNQLGSYYQFNGAQIIPITAKGYNADLKWETTTTYNVGIDFGFWNDRLTGNLDFYKRDTKDLLSYVQVAALSNLTNYLNTNIASMTNTGVELELNGILIEKRDMSWTAGLNMAWNRNEITKLNASSENKAGVRMGGISGGTDNWVQYHDVGHPMSSFYVYQQVYDKDGKPIFGQYVDRNNDGAITDSDRYFYHKPWADVTLGFNTNFTYKNWTAALSAHASLGNWVYNNVASNSEMFKDLWVNNFISNRLSSALDSNFDDAAYISDYYVENGSFLKLDNITVGYTFPELFQAFGGHEASLNVFGTVQNICTITGYKGIDPEVFGGIDGTVYPRPRTFVIGAKLNF